MQDQVFRTLFLRREKEKEISLPSFAIFDESNLLTLAIRIL